MVFVNHLECCPYQVATDWGAGGGYLVWECHVLSDVTMMTLIMMMVIPTILVTRHGNTVSDSNNYRYQCKIGNDSGEDDDGDANTKYVYSVTDSYVYILTSLMITQ